MKKSFHDHVMAWQIIALFVVSLSTGCKKMESQQINDVVQQQEEEQQQQHEKVVETYKDPSVTILSPESNYKVGISSGALLDIKGSCSLAGAEVSIGIASSIGSGSDYKKLVGVTCQSNQTFSVNKLNITAAPDATLTLSAEQTNQIGQTGRATVEIIKKMKAPSFTINTNALSGTTISATVAPSFYIFGTCSDVGSSSAVIELTATPAWSDQPLKINCIAGIWSITKPVASFPDGNVVLSAKLTDIVGNTVTQTKTLVKDTVVVFPTISITSPIENTKFNIVSTDSIVVGGSCSVPGAEIAFGAEEATQKIFTVIGRTTCKEDKTYLSSSMRLAVADGSIAITARIADTSGLASTAIVNVQKKLTEPALTLNYDSPAINVITRSIAANFHLFGNCDVPSQIEIKSTPVWPGQPFRVDCVAGQWSLVQNLSSLPDVSYLVEAKATDQVGNTAVSRNSFLKSTADPALTVSTPITNSYVNISNQTAVRFSGTCSEDYAAVFITGAVNQEATCVSKAWSKALDLSGLPQGDHTFTFTHTSAGLITKTTSVTIKKDTQLPLLTIGIVGDFEVVTNTPYILNGTCSLSEEGQDVKVTGPTAETTGVAKCTGGAWSLTLNASTVAEATLFDEVATLSDLAGNSVTAKIRLNKNTSAIVPPSLVHIYPSDRVIRLNWSSQPLAASYNVYKKTDTATAYTKLTNLTGLTYTDTGLANGTLYKYVIRAVDATGKESADSEERAARPLIRNLAKISAGPEHSCGIGSDGALRCWGKNAYGKLGDGTELSRNTPVIIDPGVKYIHVAAGRDHTCGITDTNVMKCWGANYSFQLGVPTVVESHLPIVVDGKTKYTQVSADGATCGITNTSIVKCWGYAIKISGYDSYVSTPTVLSTREHYVQVKVQLEHFCGLTTAGQARCWEYGVNDKIYISVDPTVAFKRVDIGCGVTLDGQIKCWYYPTDFLSFESAGSLDNRVSITNSIEGSNSFSDISFGYTTSCGLDIYNHIKCWGSNLYGSIGDGTETDRIKPVAIDSSQTYSYLSHSQDFHGCALTTEGSAKCWGDNYYNQLGLGTTAVNEITSPTLINSTDKFTQIAAGAGHTCGVTADGTLKCWGMNDNGQLGNGSKIGSYVPVVADPGTKYLSVGVSLQYTCGITVNNKLKCWGWYGYAPYYGWPEEPYEPTVVDSSYDYKQIATGVDRACGLTTSGSIRCWGDFIPGSRFRISQEIKDTVYTQLAAGVNHMCGLTQGMQAKCWGNNVFLQIKNDSKVSYYFDPVDINPSERFKYISASGFHSCGVVSSGNIYCTNPYFSGRTSPSQGPTWYYGNFYQIYTEIDNFCGLRGTMTTPEGMSCWGLNTSGQLGDGTYYERAAPQIIDSSTKYIQGATGRYHTCGITDQGLVKCWGNNSNGQLGLGVDTHIPQSVVSF